jgi:hypothetical protein
MSGAKPKRAGCAKVPFDGIVNIEHRFQRGLVKKTATEVMLRRNICFEILSDDTLRPNYDVRKHPAASPPQWILDQQYPDPTGWLRQNLESR